MRKRSPRLTAVQFAVVDVLGATSAVFVRVKGHKFPYAHRGSAAYPLDGICQPVITTGRFPTYGAALLTEPARVANRKVDSSRFGPAPVALSIARLGQFRLITQIGIHASRPF